MATDNSKFSEKIRIRQDLINAIDKDEINVLELYAGKSVMWNYLAKNNFKKINLFSIEKQPGKNKKALCGDNLKFIKNINLNKFDIIDVDAYGIPSAQLLQIKKKDYKGWLVVTAIQSMFGKIPSVILQSNGIRKEMIKQCPSLFNKNGLQYIQNFFYVLGARKLVGYFSDRKYYFYTKFQ